MVGAEEIAWGALPVAAVVVDCVKVALPLVVTLRLTVKGKPTELPATLGSQLTPYGQEPGLMEPLAEPRSGIRPTSRAPEVP